MRFLILILFLLVAFTFEQEITPDVEVYFCPRDDCERIFLDFPKEVCALHELDYEIDAEVVIESKYYEGKHIKDKNPALMHNKFCVGGDKVLTGSTNPTENGFHYNNNNLLIIKSKNVAKVFREEYKELKSEVQINSKNNFGNVSIYFCPEDFCRDRLIQEIKNSKKSIYFATFAFTDRAIATELILAKKRGLNVSGVLEKRMGSNMKNYLDFNGVDVTFDSNPKTMHHKFFIFDEKSVWSGSYNPTQNGNLRNDENVVLIKSGGIARDFLEEFVYLSTFNTTKE